MLYIDTQSTILGVKKALSAHSIELPALSQTLSKTGGALGSALSATGQHEAYLLTGRAGSFLYMAPEVVMCQPYNEKVIQTLNLTPAKISAAYFTTSIYWYQREH